MTDPAGEELVSRGGVFFTRCLMDRVIDEPTGQILAEVAALLELLDDLQAELKRAGAVIDGRPNPVAIELRQQRLTLARLVALLPPAEPGAAAPPPSARTLRAR